MPFFARPDLSDEQFKQLVGSELTLSGQTRIATISGLTLTDGAGGNIIVTASGASADFDVLTYCQGIISLKPSAASGGTNIYDCASPSTCTVGGLSANTTISGQSVNWILEQILVPTLDPVLTNPSLSSFTISPSATLYEIGTSISVTGTTVFNAGCINPQYTSASDCRSYGASGYSYSIYGAPPVFTASSLPSNTCSFGSKVVGKGSNTLSVYINYSGGTQPYDSSGAPYSTPLLQGCTSTCTRTICGIYPWFWGTDAVAPDISTSGCTQCLIDSYTCKCVQSSVNNVYVDNFNVTAEYLWFAIPTGNTKSCWQGANNVSNNGLIPGGLFPTPTNWHVVSPESCWGVSPLVGYEIYVSNYATDINYGMTFCN